jgi:hypothetical protein
VNVQTGLLELGSGTAGAPQKHLPCRRGQHAPVMTFEQGGADGALEFVHRSRDRGLFAVQLQRGA